MQSRIGTDLDITYRYRTRGGTGWAVQGVFEITNNDTRTREIGCTLKAVRRNRYVTERLAPGETEEFGFFMSVYRSGDKPKITHRHRAAV